MSNVSLDKAVIIRLEKSGERFEIFAEPNKALEYKKGKEIELDDILAAYEVYRDGRKGEVQSDEILKKVFGTTDFEAIAKEILKKGELHLTTEQRRKAIEDKKRKLIQYIAQNYIDPRTGAPHTEKRVELALEEARVHIDPMKSVEAQVESAVKALRPIIPLKYEVLKIAIKVPATYASKAYGIIHEFKVKQDQWASDGSYLAVVEIPPGLQSALYDKLNRVTHGDVQTKILER